MNRTTVVAFGGNALIRKGERGTQEEQYSNCEKAAEQLSVIPSSGERLLIIHGNGPQVGNILIQMEEAVTKIPPFSLDICVALSEGSMGFMLERALRNRFLSLERGAEISTILTMVIVDKDDPALKNPTKPIGPFYTLYRAQELKEKAAWNMVEDSGRGFRRVVPSPKPKEVLNLPSIKSLLAMDNIVIAGGGGGIPVALNEKKEIIPIEAVIDKDYTAFLLARGTAAYRLVFLTPVSHVSINFGSKDQRELNQVSASELKAYLAAGQFPPGSMGPKIKAAVMFIESGGEEVIITSFDHLSSALKGNMGTIIRK